ncbi:MAG: lipocalin family protein [Candidatus Cryptobacteroides sp.]
MKLCRTFIYSILTTLALAGCSKDEDRGPEYLEVNKNNISGKWELVKWNGEPLAEGTFMEIEFVRNDETFTMSQNFDSFQDIPHTVTGRYSLSTDIERGAVIDGVYDHDAGFWSHRYVISALTAGSMIWTAYDSPDFTNEFRRVETNQ